MSKYPFVRTLSTYVRRVKSDKIVAGTHLKNAVARYEKDMASGKWWFRKEKVMEVINFLGTLQHFMGEHSNKPFVLEPWQLFIIANVYGFYDKKTGRRRFQNVYIEIARKNGKTALVSALTLYHLKADNEPGGEILLTANSLDQAKICLNMVTGFVHGMDPDQKTYKRRYKDISVTETNSFIRVLAADSSKLDGYNCSLGVIDEYHSAPDSKVRDVLRSSQGMRTQPMLWTITTAGFDKSSVCWDLRTVASEIIAGVKKDDSFFSVIYSLDEEDDWKDSRVWKKSNPNLGVTIHRDFIRREVLQATNSPADEVGVRTKNLNEWMDTATTWIPDEYLIKAQADLPQEFFKDRDEPTFSGVDLASNIDLTASSYLYVSGGTYYFRTDYYVPGDTIKNGVNIDKELYREWEYHGHLIKTSGNVTDYEMITKDLLYMNEMNEIDSIYFDKWNANQWATYSTEAGLNPIPFSQTIGNFNNATKEMERLILGGKVKIDNNPITRYCFRNVSIKQDFNGNCKPIKSVEKRKIDGVISMLQALAAYMDYQANYRGISIY